MIGGGGKILKLSVEVDPPGVETPIAHMSTVPGRVSLAVAVVELITVTLVTLTPTQLETLTRKGEPTKAVPLIEMSTLDPANPEVCDIDVIVGVVFLRYRS